MAVVSEDIKFYKSAFTGSDGIGSLGGAITAEELTSGALHELFDVVRGSESQGGMTDYRCIYVQNTNVVDTLFFASAFLASQTPNENTEFAFGLGTSGIGGEEQTVDDELTAPIGVIFETGIGSGEAQDIGDLLATEYHAIWFRRQVTAGAAASQNDNATITVQGEDAGS